MSELYILLTIGLQVFTLIAVFFTAFELKSMLEKLHDEREVSVRVTTTELSDIIQKARSSGGIHAKISNNDGSIVNMLVAVRDEKPKVVLK